MIWQAKLGTFSNGRLRVSKTLISRKFFTFGDVFVENSANEKNYGSELKVNGRQIFKAKAHLVLWPLRLKTKTKWLHFR